MSSWGKSSHDLRGGPGALTFVVEIPDGHDVRTGTPLSSGSPAGRVFEGCLNEAGLRRDAVNVLLVAKDRPPRDLFVALKHEVIDEGVRDLHAVLRRLAPSLIVTFGASAAHAVVPEWPDGRDPSGLTHRGRIKSATDIENRRGYIFDSPFGPTLTTVAPSSVVASWTPWRMLLSYDLQRAQEISQHGFARPEREVVIVGSDRDCQRALADLRSFRRLSADIETWRDTSLACIGFAGESGKAYVFPARYAARTEELLRDPSLTTVWANGIYDLFVLKHREGWKIGCEIEDVQVAWHSAYPELAGAKAGKGRRHTRKSLAFLASMCTSDAWWKGDYETQEEFFIYNGKDCCITHDVDRWVQGVVDEVGARATYDLERSLMMPCVDMLQRGLYVDEEARASRAALLEARVAEVRAEANAVVIPLLDRERDRLTEADLLRLFEEIDPTCECCGHGAKKQMECWACAGFEKAPTKADMMRKFRFDPAVKISKAELQRRFLPICHVCGGAPRETRLVFNPNSDAQSKALFYEVLRLPKRFKRNSKGESVLTTDEKALKSLAGVVEEKMG